MKSVQLLVGLLIGDTNQPAGSVVELDDRRAEDLIRQGAAGPPQAPPEAAPAPEPAPARPAKGKPRENPPETKAG